MTSTTELLPSYLDVTRLAIASFLARYREPTLTAYTQNLKAYLGWCQQYDLDVLRVSRGELEMYVRHLEGRGYATATIARRFGTVATLYKYALIDGVIAANPADAVTRPKVAWEGQKRTVLHPLEFAAMLSAARTSSPNDDALVCMLGMLGLRVSEACNADITDIRYESGYELLHVIGKGAEPADTRCPSQCSAPCGRRSLAAPAGRSCGLGPGGGWTAPAPAALCPGSLEPPASATRSARTAFAARSAPPAWSPASRSGTCNAPCGTPTRGPRSGTTWPRPISTATQPTVAAYLAGMSTG
ncbi:MAG TPA: site-specific integrase [Mycobacteriales bacterium]|nr:site-specific integrase [Mycobacteriales bacterium]